MLIDKSKSKLFLGNILLTILHLGHKVYETDTSENYDLDLLNSLMDQDMSAAILYMKECIVQDERVRRKDPVDNALWLYSEARKIVCK